MWCREQCTKGHEWVWLVSDDMKFGDKWPCGCLTNDTSTAGIDEWPEGCLKVGEERRWKTIRKES